MTRIVTILADDFADWETTLLNGVARGFYKAETAYATPGGRPVVSSGGMRVTPDLAVEDIDVGTLDVLVVCGGGALERPDAPDFSATLNAAHAAGKIVAGICAGTLQLAKSGLLDNPAHTSNARDYIASSGYRGGTHYRDGAEAVLDDRIVTAAGTSPVSFMAKVMESLGLADDQLRYYLGLHAAQYGKLPSAA